MSEEKQIRAKHVIAAAKVWDEKPRYRGFGPGTRYEVLINGKSYPPKAIASYAYELAGNKDILYPKAFGGAWEGKWHRRLEIAGFKPQLKSENAWAKLPMKSFGVDEEKEYPEGEKIYKFHLCPERDREVVNEAKRSRWQKEGAFKCDVCGFDFAKFYGERGEGYIEAHHTIPVGQMERGHKTKVKDLALVCANCHRMLHAMKLLISVNQLKTIIGKAIKKGSRMK